MNGPPNAQLENGHGPPPCGVNEKLKVADVAGINPAPEMLMTPPGFTVGELTESVSAAGAWVGVGVAVGVGVGVLVGVGAAVGDAVGAVVAVGVAAVVLVGWGLPVGPVGPPLVGPVGPVGFEGGFVGPEVGCPLGVVDPPPSDELLPPVGVPPCVVPPV